MQLQDLIGKTITAATVVRDGRGKTEDEHLQLDFSDGTRCVVVGFVDNMDNAGVYLTNYPDDYVPVAEPVHATSRASFLSALQGVLKHGPSGDA